MGQILVASANPGVASWSQTGTFTLASGTGSTAVNAVTGLPAALIGAPVLLSFGSVPTDLASVVGTVVADGLAAKLQVVSYDGTGAATDAGVSVTVVYAILAV